MATYGPGINQSQQAKSVSHVISTVIQSFNFWIHYLLLIDRYSEAALAKSANFQHELIHEIAHWAHITPNIQEVPQV